MLRRAAAAAFTLLANPRGVLPLDPGALRTLAVIGPNALAPVSQGGGSAAVNQVSVSRPADALRTALAGRAQVIAEPGCVTWEAVPEPPPGSLTDPDTGEPGTRLEFRAPDGHLIAAEHRTATMFTWWEGLPDGIGWGGQGRILLRARFRADRDGAHLIGAGGVGRLALFVNGTGLAEGITPDPADPVEAMVRPGEIRAAVTLRAGQEAEIEVALLPSGGAPGPVSIRLGVVPAPDEDALLAAAEQAARGADAAIVIVGSAPAAESEGFDRPGLALTGRQDELVRRIAAVNDRTVVVVNAGMPVLMPWADEVAAVGYAWLGGQAMGDALADVLFGAVEPGGRLPVTLPVAEADCPVLHAVPRDGQLRYSEGLLIGYRGFDRAGTSPRFPFGHGLGYTSWALESARPAMAPGPGRDAAPARTRAAGSGSARARTWSSRSWCAIPGRGPAGRSSRPTWRPRLGPRRMPEPRPGGRSARWPRSGRRPRRRVRRPRSGCAFRPARSPVTTSKRAAGSGRAVSSPCRWAARRGIFRCRFRCALAS